MKANLEFAFANDDTVFKNQAWSIQIDGGNQNDAESDWKNTFVMQSSRIIERNAHLFDNWRSIKLNFIDVLQFADLRIYRRMISAR